MKGGMPAPFFLAAEEPPPPTSFLRRPRMPSLLRPRVELDRARVTRLYIENGLVLTVAGTAPAARYSLLLLPPCSELWGCEGGQGRSEVRVGRFGAEVPFNVVDTRS